MEKQQNSHMEFDTEDINHEESRVSVNLNGIPINSLRFDSEDEAYEFYNLYAKCVGFSIRKHWRIVGKKDKKLLSRIFCCSRQGEREKHSKGTPTKPRPQTRTNCAAQIKIQFDKNSGKFIVENFKEEHNHKLAHPTRVHLLRSHREVKPVQESLIHKLTSAGMGSSDIYFYFSKEVGGFENVNFTQMDCDNIVQKRRREFLKIGDGQLLLDYFKQKQKENNSFYYLIKTDESNQIHSCFWCDAKSRIDYQWFGDVVCFDTTYQTNEYRMPFAPIVGVNNHRQTVIFGGALLGDETTETFVWLFQTFLDAMGGKAMDTIFTDQASAMAKAIKQVLPNTHHRLCIWHIYQNALKNLSHVFNEFSTFAPDFKKCIYDAETNEEFFLEWEKLLTKYKLQENEWLQGLFKLREKWAQVYGMVHFCAGMASTQRSESMNNYFKKYFKRKNILREFMDQYEKAVSLRRHKEANADIKSKTTSPILVSKWHVECHASEIYTRKMFNCFQEEVKATLDLEAKLVNDDGKICIYEVFSYNGARTRTIEFVSSDNIVQCSCRKFEFNGLLCAHALKVLRIKNVQDLPSQYLLQRWKKDGVPDVVVDTAGNILKASMNPSLTVRYSELSDIAKNIVVKGSTCETLSEIAKHGMNRVLDELESASQALQDNTTASLEIIDENPNNDVEKFVVDHSVEETLHAPPRKKLKGQPASRPLGVSDFAKGKGKSKPKKKQKTPGTKEKSTKGKKSRTTESCNPTKVARASNDDDILEIIAGYINNTSSKPSSYELHSSSSLHGRSQLEDNIVQSSIQDHLTSQDEWSDISLLPYSNPYIYNQGSIMVTDNMPRQQLYDDNTQYNQGFVGLLSQRTSNFDQFTMLNTSKPVRCLEFP